MVERGERHHLQYRSKGGGHETANVLLICRTCHDAVHVKGTLKLSGDADLRDERGNLSGVKVERATDSGWKVDKWV